MKKSNLHEATAKLNKLITQGKKKLGKAIDPQTRNKYNRSLGFINKNFQTNIPCIGFEQTQAWLDDIKSWWHILYNKLFRT